MVVPSLYEEDVGVSLVVVVKGFAVVIRSDFRGRNLPAKKQIKHKKNHNRAQNFSLFDIIFSALEITRFR